MKISALLSLIACFVYSNAYSQAKKMAAEITEFSGTVRVRRNNDQTWKTLEKSIVLFEGDRLFVDSKSSARLQFGDKGRSIVSIGPRSIYEVKNTPPISQIVLRGFDTGKGEIQQVESMPKTLEGFIASAKSGSKSSNNGQSQNNNSNDNSQSQQVNAIDVQQKVVSLQTYLPKAKVYLNAKKLPVLQEYKIENPEISGTELYGTLWRTEPKPRAPIWTGKLTQKNNFNFEGSIAIPHEGSFYFQAQSKDGTVVADGFEIDVKENKFQPISSILPLQLRPKEVVVFQ